MLNSSSGCQVPGACLGSSRWGPTLDKIPSIVGHMHTHTHTLSVSGWHKLGQFTQCVHFGKVGGNQISRGKKHAEHAETKLTPYRQWPWLGIKFFFSSMLMRWHWTKQCYLRNCHTGFFFYSHVFSVLLSIYIGVELLGKYLCLTSCSAKLFSKPAAYHFAHPPAILPFSLQPSEL